ncbi:SAM domain-containing protein [Hirschfeldia incana]|nr:SAM domain-containing protein [Hirschfeldia incana]
MAELQPGDNIQQLNGGVTPSLPSTSAEALAIAAGGGSKRMRRPSVRLGEIGGDYHHAPPYDSQSRKPKWAPTGNKTKSSTRTRALTNIETTLDDENADSFGVVGSWRVKKRVGSSTSTGAAKRVSPNWEESEGGFRDFSREDSESPVKEESLVRDGGLGFYGREGVKIWLQELGLGRYWPMFEIHEVDDEVLPLLTLDDLKDMGISAVGSRRKMFSAIQKLGREFS